jgi:hypothetical protein
VWRRNAKSLQRRGNHLIKHNVLRIAINRLAPVIAIHYRRRVSSKQAIMA